MKFFKKTLSVILVVVLIVISTISVFAQSATETENQTEENMAMLTFELTLYAIDYQNTFRLWDDYLENRIRCDKASGEELLNLINEVFEYHEEVCNGRKTTIEEIDNYYKRLDDAAEKVIILHDELMILIDCCKQEKNDNLYYSEELWSEFRSKLAVAEQVYNKGEDTIEVSNAYWDLLFAYNEICVVNGIPGDVDFDGRVTIFDATLIQFNLAKTNSFNSSQIYVGDLTLEDSDISIMDATTIQMYLAKIYDTINSDRLLNLQENIHHMDRWDNDLFAGYRNRYHIYI